MAVDSDAATDSELAVDSEPAAEPGAVAEFRGGGCENGWKARVNKSTLFVLSGAPSNWNVKLAVFPRADGLAGVSAAVVVPPAEPGICDLEDDSGLPLQASRESASDWGGTGPARAGVSLESGGSR